MNTPYLSPLVRALVLLVSCTSFSASQLSVQDPSRFNVTGPGYIDSVTIVVEPHGASVEQALYVYYADHRQFPGNRNIEVIHRFRLPAHAVVNDLWLWIGDTVIQAKMFDTWTARNIYDSIVTRMRDPAFLAKSGDWYELHVFPLVSGSFRKIRLNLLAPTTWLGDTATAELPLAFLKDNHASQKPARLLFRTRHDVWGLPSVRERPDLTFTQTFDERGFRFRYCEIPDVGSLSSLSVTFSPRFIDGMYVSANPPLGDSTYYQVGVDPTSLGILRSDTGAAHVVVGLDLTSGYDGFDSVARSSVAEILARTVRPVDRMSLIAAGADTVVRLASRIPVTRSVIDTIMNALVNGPLGFRLHSRQIPVVLYADQHASSLWSFDGVESFGVPIYGSYLVEQMDRISNSQIVASYDHGYESRNYTQANALALYARIDTLFMKGGRFVGFYDYNRVASDVIGPHYINGLTEKGEHSVQGQTLYANADGTIGSGFPATFVANVVNYLQYDDPDVTIEVANALGEPVVISKKISNGLMVVSGLWSFADDLALRQALAIPMLGLGSRGKGAGQMLGSLLAEIQSIVNHDSTDLVYVISNADSAITKNEVGIRSTTYLSGFQNTPPTFHSVELLNGALYLPERVTDQGIDYYGAGYYLRSLSYATGGMHFERHMNSWGIIGSALAYSRLARIDSFVVSVQVDGGAGMEYAQRAFASSPNDRKRPQFVIGVTNAKTKLDIRMRAVSNSEHVVEQHDTTVFMYADSAFRMPVLGSLMGLESLKDLMTNAPTDTSSIVQMALKHHLMCDFTALIALEPDEQNQPLTDPFDESELVNTNVEWQKTPSDSISIGAYPNPFNASTVFVVESRTPMDFTVEIYDVLGQLVRTLDLASVGGRSHAEWNARDLQGRSVATGIYFARVIFSTNGIQSQAGRVIKVLLLR